MAKVDLEDILRRARRRDPNALSTLVELYSPRLFGLLYRLSGSREVAEDLMQETFLRVVRTIDRYEHSGKFDAWLFRIAANLARDRARSGRRHGASLPLHADAVEDTDADSMAASAGHTDPALRAMQKEAGERLAECLERLPEPQREILLLRHYSGLSFAEIAELLDIPLGTALARAHRALARLRVEFEGEA